MGLCWNHTVTKNEARQRGCDLGTAGQQLWEGTRAGGDGGVLRGNVCERAGAVTRY